MVPVAPWWLAACAPTAELAPPWDGADERPALDHPMFSELPELSLYAGHVAGADRPDHAHRGTFAVGNGRAFAMLGLADPLNTLHGLVGPVYENDPRFFGDHAVLLQVDGEVAPFDEEWIARPRGTGLVVTRADTPELTLYTLDGAPSDGSPVIVRDVGVVSRAATSRDVALRLVAARTLDGLVEVAGDRRLSLEAPGLAPVDGGAVLPLGALAPGEALQTRIVYATGDYEAPDLADTLAWWADEAGKGLSLETDDPRVADLYDGMRAAITVQTTSSGGVSPMSRYTLVWTRDTIGAVRFWLRAGRPDRATAALDYLHRCHVVRGDIGNACSSALDDETPPDPDWAALGAFSGRTAAEGPSHIPLMYRDHARWTGDTALVDARWPYLARAVLAQEMTADGLQPFSGDETYRFAMSAALGYELTYAWEANAWSANSSFLMAPAADFLAEQAERRGEDPSAFADRAARARAAVASHFTLPDGGHAPFLGFDGSTAERPFEDVALMPLWAGGWSPDDPAVADALAALEASAGRGDGTFQTPLHPSVPDAFGAREGIYTGMLPGYALFALTAFGDARDGFGAVHRYADPAGMYDEDGVYDDLSALHPYYDDSGSLGDISARYRPWEGGVVLDAMLSWLVGAEPVEGGIRLRPHVPPSSRGLVARGIAVGGLVGDLEVERDGRSLTATLTVTAGAADVRVQLPLPEGARPIGETFALPGGEVVAVFAPLPLAAGDTATWTARWR